MDLICYVEPGWAPLIRPAPATRPWMDATAESFAYRCLPLDIANAHGWEILCPCGFEAVWNGRPGTDAVTIVPDAGAVAHQVPASLFGQGIVTFHIEGIIRTPPGWNLWVGGSPNRFKDGVQPLGGVIETDWSPYTFTMNWRFTRPNQKIRFEKHEAMCFFFPVQRSTIEAFQPRFAPLSDDPETLKRFHDWSRARNEFHQRIQIEPPRTPADRWQKHYYRGVDVSGRQLLKDHQAKLRPKPFNAARTSQIEVAPPDDGALPLAPGAPVAATGEVQALRAALRQRDQLMETLERQRDLCPATAVLERRGPISAEEFLERYYAVNCAVILEGELASWPALSKWSPEYLDVRAGVGLGKAPFEIDPVLLADLGSLEKFLLVGHRGKVENYLASTLTPIQQQTANCLLCQISGSSQINVSAPSETGKILSQRRPDSGQALPTPQLAGIRSYDIVLNAGDVLFLPLGWWHQMAVGASSVIVTQTEFRWPNNVAHL